MGVDKQTGGMVEVTLHALLLRLEAEEAIKPAGQRRAVPSAAELAKAAGVHRATIYDYINGAVRRLSLDVSAAILTELWQRGFNVGASDLLVFRPPETRDSEATE